MDLMTLTRNINFCYCPSGCCSLICHAQFFELLTQGRNLTTQIRIMEPHSPEEERVALEAIGKGRAEGEKVNNLGGTMSCIFRWAV